MPATADPSTRFMLSETSPLLANMAALWSADAALAEEMESVLAMAPYPIETAKSGEATLALGTQAGGRIFLHSRYRPRDEAKKLIDSCELEGKVVFAIHGFGLGYHVEELFDRASDEALHVIIEPDLLLLRTVFEHRDFSRLIGTGRLIFLTKADRGALMLRLATHQALICVGLTSVTHAPSVQLQGEFHRQMGLWIEEYIAYCRTSINTLVLNGRRTCENIAKNLSWYAAAPAINRLKGRHAGQPAIIVSAGPSLRRNQHLLASAKGKAVLIAVQTSLQPLLDGGVEPDYVTSLDYHDICTRFFEKLPKNLRTELVAESKASSAIFSLYPGPLSLLGHDFGDRLLSPLQLRKDRLRAGATVAHLAFYLAEYLGCDPIIFIGQDLGFSDGLAYTPGTSYEDVWWPELGRFCTVEMKQWEHIARERPILRRIPDYQGRAMYTEERLFSYLQQFERDFSVTRARVIDASEGGALKRGAHPMPLAQAIAEFCQSELPPNNDDHPGLNWGNVRDCDTSLQRRFEEAQTIAEIGGQTLPLLQEVRDCIEDQPKVNRLIARIDALRARMMELNDCYELVMQLTQQTELDRFRSDRQIAASKVSGIERQKKQLERDIANVRGVVEAARQFQRLIEDARQRLAEALTSSGRGVAA